MPIRLLSAALLAGSFLSAPAVVEEPEPEVERPLSAPLSEAEHLYREGSALYEATDYNAAIAKFTVALQLVSETETEGGRGIKLDLLFNIARAHEMAYAIDEDITHLRQAKALYQRYEQEHDGDEEQVDVTDRIATVEAELEALVVEPEPRPAEPDPIPKPPDDSWRRHRSAGIGLTVSGVAAVLGGVTLAVLGSRYEPNARDEVAKLADLGIPPDDPAWAEGEVFIEDERKKGVALMAVGGSVAALGAIAAGFGAKFLVESKREKRSLNVAASMAPGSAMLIVSGRF